MNHYLKLACLFFPLAAMGGCSSSDPVEDTSHLLVWRKCSAESKTECAELKVPSSYSANTSEKIEIGINRVQATTQPAAGVLLLNPGGPGGSGLELLETLSTIDALPDYISSQFDVIGFDPRGIGVSTAVNCNEFGIAETDQYVANSEEIQALIQESTRIASSCFEKYGDYLLQLGSLNVVRDMDEIRKALGSPTINFLGYSYGSRLAALYLQYFPENSSAIILDGSLKPNSAVLPLIEESFAALEKNLASMLNLCTSVDPTCDPAQLHQQLNEISKQYAAEQDSEAFELLGEMVNAGATDPEFAEFLIAPLVNFLNTGEINALKDFAILTGLLEEDPEDDDSITAQVAVMCADDVERPTQQSLELALDRFNQQSDLFAETSLPLAATCAGWPNAIEPLADISTRTAPASLVIGGSSDAQTPIQWSQEMANAIGGYYLGSSHKGHTVVFTDSSECVEGIVQEFLQEGRLPTDADCLSDE